MPVLGTLPDAIGVARCSWGSCPELADGYLSDPGDKSAKPYCYEHLHYAASLGEGMGLGEWLKRLSP